MNRLRLLHLLACLLFLSFAAFINLRQEDPYLPGGKEKVRVFWDAVVMEKASNLAFDYGAKYEPGGNQAKRNYRLIPPLLARAFGLQGLRVIELLSWVMLGVCIYVAVARVSSARSAYCAALAVLCTSSGAVYFNDLAHTCDVIAQALLALNLVFASPWLMASTVCLALFTDERSVLAILLLVPLVGWRKAWPYLVGIAAYASGRFALGTWLYAPTNYADVGCWDYILAGLRLLPAVIWGALEGAWLLLGAAVFALWKRDRVLAAGLVLYPLACMCLSSAVLDMTRSASYAMLAPVVALVLARLPEPRAFWLCSIAALISMICPNSMFIAGFIETFK